MRIPGPQTQGMQQTIMGPPTRSSPPGGSILYPIQISQSLRSLMSKGPVVISHTGKQCSSPSPWSSSTPARTPQGDFQWWSPKQTPNPQAMNLIIYNVLKPMKNNSQRHVGYVLISRWPFTMWHENKSGTSTLKC